jgi:hypothetical protein
VLLSLLVPLRPALDRFEKMQRTKLLFALQWALLSLAAVNGTPPPGTTTVDLDSPFLPCPFPAFDAAVRRFSKALTFKTVSSVQADSHALQPEQFEQLW